MWVNLEKRIPLTYPKRLTVLYRGIHKLGLNKKSSIDGSLLYISPEIFMRVLNPKPRRA